MPGLGGGRSILMLAPRRPLSLPRRAALGEGTQMAPVITSANGEHVASVPLVGGVAPLLATPRTILTLGGSGFEAGATVRAIGVEVGGVPDGPLRPGTASSSTTEIRVRVPSLDELQTTNAAVPIGLTSFRYKYERNAVLMPLAIKVENPSGAFSVPSSSESSSRLLPWARPGPRAGRSGSATSQASAGRRAVHSGTSQWAPAILAFPPPARLGLITSAARSAGTTHRRGRRDSPSMSRPSCPRQPTSPTTLSVPCRTPRRRLRPRSRGSAATGGACLRSAGRTTECRSRSRATPRWAALAWPSSGATTCRPLRS